MMDTDIDIPAANIDKRVAASRNIEARDYWLGHLSGELPKTRFQYDFSAGTRKKKTASLEFKLPAQHLPMLMKLSHGSDYALHFILTAALAALLYRCAYTDNESRDIIIGTPILRQKQEAAFINTALPLRIQLKDNRTFKGLLLQVREIILNAIKHRDYPVEILAEQLGLISSGEEFALFEIAVLLTNIHDKNGIGHIPLNLVFSFSRDEDGIGGVIEYNSALYRETAVKQISYHYIRLLGEVLANVEVEIAGIEILTEEERRRLILEFNNTAKEYPREKTIHELFARQAARTPDSAAIVGAHELHELHEVFITYKELNHKSNQLAYLLREKGVGPDTIVGIMSGPSIELITGILAILKAGGAYLPIDPEYPEERKQYMLADSGAGVLVSELSELSEVSKVSEETGVVTHPTHLGYIIYTSGSTGKPKGSAVEHRNVVRLFFTDAPLFDFNGSDVWTLFHSASFDFSVWEMYGALLFGGKLVILSRGEARDTRAFLEILRRCCVTVLNQTPSAFYALMAAESSAFVDNLDLHLRYVIFGGEALNPARLSPWRAKYPAVKLINMYGITETTVHVTYKEITEKEIESETSNIGVPIPTLGVCILDRNLRLVPPGVTGEICVYGEGLCRGYLNRPELTAEKFDHDLWDYRDYHDDKQKLLRGVQGGSFLEKSPPGRRRQRLYKTGDLGRVLENGDLEHLGRIDHQVKIRGFRIELGEIENRLLKHESIKEAAVIARETKTGERVLCAYLVLEGGFSETFDRNAIKEYLSHRLPDYMIPVHMVVLEGIPLTLNGKIDRKALPEPTAAAAAYTAPRDEIEKKLVEIWSDVLKLQTLIGIDDNFFQLGGHSLNATVVVALIHKKLDVKIPLAELFRTPFIRVLSQYIKESEQDIYAAVEPVEKKEYYPLSSAQKRLFFLDRYEEIGTSYNIPSAVLIRGTLDRNRFERAFAELIARHESLRTSFRIVNNEPVQQVHEEVAFRIEDSAGSFVRPFNLSQAPLLRVGLVKLPDARYLLHFDLHHIIADGTSMGILVDDFSMLYNGELQSALRIQYKDFSRWQDRLFESGGIREQESYWMEQYKEVSRGDIEPLILPYDYPRPAVLSFAGGVYSFALEGRQAHMFKTLAVESGATLFMNLMAAFNVLLHHYSGQEDMVVGTGIMGRPHADLKGIIGMFVNSLAIRNQPAASISFRDFLRQVKHNCIKAFANQDLQFEELVDKLDLRRDPSRNPLFDALCVVQNFETAKKRLKGVTLEPYAFENNTSKFDLSLYGKEIGDTLVLSLEYSTALFKPGTIRQMANRFIGIVEQINENPDIPVGDIELMAAGEKRQLLDDFNRTGTGFPGDKTIPQLFAEIAGRAPGHTAVVYQGHITYDELNRRSNQLAHYLRREKGIQADDRVGLLMDRSLEQMIAVMGVLKAGAAYVPISPGFPEERIKDMIDDAGIGVVVSQKRSIRTLNRLQWGCPGFHTYLCMDSRDVHGEEETEKSELMGRKLWEYVGETAGDEITGGGWLSSYTGEPIPEEEMDEYGGNILKKLTPLLHGGMKVLEIGCASGISMYRLAPLVGAYYGTDLSSVIIRKNRERVKEEGHTNIHLARLAAHEIDTLGERDFDLVIINSVIQCFHGHNYLRGVLHKVVHLVSDNGYLFIGDIMDRDLQGELVRDLRQFKQTHKGRGYTTKTDWSVELFVSRAFWEDMLIEIPGISTVTFTDKIYTIENELTRFRYDALFTINKKNKKKRPLRSKHKYQQDRRALEAYLMEANNRVSPGNLAYIIYTSGSTGRAKGTLTTHANVIRVVRDSNYIELTPSDRLLQLSDYAFDGSVFDIFGALLNGAALVMARKEDVPDIRRLSEILRGEAVTVFFLTTALFNTLVDIQVDGLHDVRKVLFGGEQVSLRHVQRALAYLGRDRIIHVYGPTETTVYATYYPVDAVDERVGTVPIGKPISNTVIYILDRRMRPVPIGITGEIYIGGQGVARGYLNHPVLTSERFVDYRSYKSYRTYRTYKTGDLGRWLADGTIEFQGRVDRQVKIRGFRIEPGEIERRLMAHDDVKEAVVPVRQRQHPQPHLEGEKFICAYIVWNKNGDPAELKEYLAAILPDYMVPAHIVPLEKMPLNQSGKVDRNALPEPAIAAGEEYSPPRDKIEEKLVTIWGEVLGLTTLTGIDDNFFERGGHSLKAAILVNRIRKEFDVEFPLTLVFSEPTIRAMGEYILGAEQRIYDEIVPVEEREYYPQSSAQKRLFLLDRFENIGIGYNMPMVLKLEGEVDVTQYEEAFRGLAARHESLRTSFHWIADEPVQRVHEEVEFKIEEATTPRKHEGIIKRFIRPFDLSRAPLLRVGLVKLPDNEYLLLFDMHHIVSDGTSMSILVDDFIRFYSGADLLPPRVQYKDFSRWQNNLFALGRIKEQEDYWLSVYPEPRAVPRLNLPSDYVRPPVYRFDGDRYGFTLEAGDAAAFRRLASLYREENPGDRDGASGVTLFMNLLAAFTALLYRYSGQDDIVVGTGIAGRPHADLQGIIGMFINSLALRNRPYAGLTYMEFLRQVKETSLKAFENQDLQFESLVERLNPTRDSSRNPLFDVCLMVQNFEGAKRKMKETSVSPYEQRAPISKFDITLLAYEIGGAIYFDMEYCTALFKQETIRRMASHFVNTLRCVGRNPYVPLADIDIMTGEERLKVLSNFNSPSINVSYPLDKTIHHLFAEQAQKTPHHTVVSGISRGVRDAFNITYRELDKKSTQLAYLLNENGVKPDTIAGIMIEPSIELIIGILAILKAGGAYLPIDPKYPRERIDYMLKDSNAAVLVSELGEVSKVSEGTGFVVHPDHLCYLIYTSGSTGKPKGVMVEHRNVVNLVWGLQERIYSQYPRYLNVALVASVVFDASVQQIFTALLRGHCLSIMPEAVKVDTGKLLEFYFDNKIDITDGTPAHLRMMAAGLAAGLRPPGLKHLLIGGEALPAPLVKEFRELYERAGAAVPAVTNVYGPTECCVDSAFFDISREAAGMMEGTIPIGNPMPGEQVYIVFPANYRRLQPIGVPGELCITGVGVGRGYLNNPELTAGKFANYRSYRSYRTYSSKKIYKTGDLARWLPDGTIEFLGRMDRQVKIRGYRIEPGEIENHLSRHPGIKAAVVLERKNEGGDGVLCAYIAADTVNAAAVEKAITSGELKEYLSKQLPLYMIPTHFIQVDEIPLTAAGKVDRNALPAPGPVKGLIAAAAPRDEIEGKLAGIWWEVLGLQTPVGIDSNFFELGGHSLTAALMVLKIHKEFRVKIALEQVFRVPTVRELAAIVRETGNSAYVSIPPAPARDYYPVSSAQKRLYILQQMDRGQIGYNLPQVVTLAGKLERQQLETAFKGMIKRHESLRTSFHMRDNEPVQAIHEDVDFKIEYYVLAGNAFTMGYKAKGREDMDKHFRRFLRPFDLSKAPLVRAGLIQTGTETHILMLDMHHIISDGVSNDIFVNEMIAFYHGIGLPAVPLQYKDFSCWQNRLIESGQMKQQESYWLEVFPEDGIPALLNLPVDYPRPGVRSFAGDHLMFTAGPRSGAALSRLAVENNASLYMVLLAGYTVFLSRLTGREDMVVGSPIAGRGHVDLQRTIGMFVNTLAIRSFPNWGLTFKEYLADVRNRTLKAFENQDYPFEDLVENVVKHRDTSRNPLVDVVFTFQNMSGPAVENPGTSLEIKPYEYENPTSKFDLSFLGIDRGPGEIPFIVEYSTALFKKETVRRFIRYFKTVLEVVVENPDRRVGDIEILSREERQELLAALDNTAVEYPEEKTIHQLFAEQAARTPDSVAIVGAHELHELHEVFITYKELNHKSNQLAHLLREKGAGPDTIVGICMEPSIELIIGILGILKAGGAYLPIDPEYPEERKQYMLADSGAGVLVSELSEVSKVSEETGVVTHPTHLGYIIYTSGSTGKPRGSAVEHRNVARLFFTDAPLFDFNGGDVWTLFHSASFDFSVWEMYGALLFGGKLVILSRGEARDTRAFPGILRRCCVTVLNQTPSAFYALMAAESSAFVDNLDLHLRYVIFGGEALNPARLSPWKAKYPDVKLINMYGITETTVHVTYKEITEKEIESETSNIGVPIPTLGICLLDRNLRPVPPGVTGEICVYGEGLCRGYLNHPELTAEKFDHDLWDYRDYHDDKQKLLRGVQGGGFLEKSPPGRRRQRLYKTGDLARLLADGTLEFLGRIDHQVKIRGFRIELGEIESRLLEHENIKEAVVIARETGVEDGQKYLCAYIVPVDSAVFAGTSPNKELRQYLSRVLPGYMIPGHFVVLDRIPLTVNGKLDRKNLPGPRFRPSVHYAAPGSELEEQLIMIWSEVLGAGKEVLPRGGSAIGVEDNFFDLGGNSLDIVKVSNKIKEALDIDMPVIKLFEYPTIGSLARFIRGKEERTYAVPGGGRSVEIAVIGMAGRFPGAGNIELFWENLKNGVESISFFADGELEAVGLAPGLIQGPGFVKSDGGLLEDKEYFDAAFFDYTPRQAEVMSPQMRILHEVAWEAMEHAGYVPDRCDFPVGLFAGASSGFYWEALWQLSGKTDLLGQFASSLLVNKDHVVTHVSYKLNLKGPALMVQTACSTSLAAIDLAARAIPEGRCRMALAGGVAVNLSPSKGYRYREGMVQSPDGHCRAFAAEAGGLVGGEGAGLVVLKHLQDALADGDTVYAVIKGTAVNNDGSRKVGYTAPSIQGQAEVIKAALQMAKVPAESITYVETHGTGTALGDPVEIRGLTTAFDSDKRGFCRIGSVKTNIGHLDAAAGAAGFIKTVLALKHRQIPPSLHFNTPNREIDFHNTPFVVNTELTPWEGSGYPLRAGVSSFGIGGTNVHVILEEAPGAGGSDSQRRGGPPCPPSALDEFQLIVLSAKTAAALDKMTENLAKHFKKYPGINLADAAYTLQVGRKAFNHRRMVVCADAAEAIKILDNKQAGSIRSAAAVSEKEPTLVFMFAGLGSQYVNMGRDLYETEPGFRKTMDRGFEILRRLMDCDIKEFLYPSPVSPVTSVAKGLDRTEVTQPVIFIFEYALAALLMSWGIRPAAMMGYSFGEYAAAAAAGVFSLEDGLKLVVRRGELIRELDEGAMLSVPLGKDKLLPLLKDKENLSLAVDNGESCIVSGPVGAVKGFEREMKEQKCFCLPVPGNRAIHSAMMGPILGAFEKEVSQLTLKPPGIPYISNVSGDWIAREEAVDPRYWSRHLLQTVQFDPGIRKLLDEVKTGSSIFIEIGPGRDIGTLVSRYTGKSSGHRVMNSVRHPLEAVKDDRYLIARVGGLWLNGVGVDWNAFHNIDKGEKRRRIPLPAYAFAKERFWDQVDAFEAGGLRIGKEAAVPVGVGGGFVDKSQRGMVDWFYTPVWEQAPLPAVDTFLQESGQPGSFCRLVFMDECGIGRRLLQRIETEPGSGEYRVVIVEKGSRFERVGTGTDRYIIDPGQPGHFDTLFRHLKRDRRVPRGIFHLWGLAPPVDDTEKTIIDIFNEAQEAGFYSLIYMVQAMGRANITGSLQLTAVTNNMQEVTGGEALCPEKATVLGVIKSIPLEYPHIRCRGIDILVPEPGTAEEDRLLSQLQREFSGEFVENEVEIIAFRGYYRWKQTFRPLPLVKPVSPVGRLREKGVYLITGGFGGMGFTLARDLAGNFNARLILAGRSPFPGKQEWDRWIADHGGDDDTSRKIRQIREMEQGGAEVMIARADVSSLENMQRVVQEAEARFGPVNGIIHTAAVIDYGGIIQRRGKETAEAVLAPKAGGLLVLESLFDPGQLDFVMIFSSIASVLTPFGQVGYAAANAFLDAYVFSRSHYNGKYTVINWSDWLEVGMAVKAITKANEGNPERISSELESMTPIALTPGEGTEAFHRILAYRHPRVVVCIQELGVMTRFHNRYNTKRGGGTGEHTLHRRPELSTQYRAPVNEFERTVAGVLQQYLAIDRVGIDDNFFELGLSSLDIIQVNMQLKEVLKKEIPLVTMFTYPTIGHFSMYMDNQEEAGQMLEETGIDQAGELLQQSINLLREK